MKYITAFLLIIAMFVAPLGSAVWGTRALAAAPEYSGYPTFSIVSVVADSSVTIKTSNLPANDTFVVRMGKMGTRGVNGVKGVEFDTGSGGAQTFTFDIPASLQGLYQIAIRIQSVSGSGYFAYNWFYNNTSGTGGTGGGTGGQPSGYSGYPTIKIISVVKDTTVTIRLMNLPANDEFRVLMGVYGTRGVGGTKITSIDTGEGGDQKYTYDIPAAYQGDGRIAVRIESKTGSGFFAYNWFYNSTTP
jgi:hypothetical protein